MNDEKRFSASTPFVPAPCGWDTTGEADQINFDPSATDEWQSTSNV